jgi:hypothetical protein
LVQNQLDDEDRDWLELEGYIARVGASTRKIYPYGKPTKAKTVYYATPELLKTHEDLMVEIYKREAYRLGYEALLGKDPGDILKDNYTETWENVTVNGVES